MSEKLIKIAQIINKFPRNINYITGKCANDCRSSNDNCPENELKYAFCKECKNIVCNCCIDNKNYNWCLICTNKKKICRKCKMDAGNVDGIFICNICNQIILQICSYCDTFECVYGFENDYPRYCEMCWQKHSGELIANNIPNR